MASRRNPPTARLRRLASELLRLRKVAKLSREAVTERTGINNVTLYRLETGRSRPQRRTLLALLDLYDVDRANRVDLLELSQAAEYPGWLRQYQSELPEIYTAFISFEAEARSSRNYESLLMPGLLQTEEYARAVVKGVVTWASTEQVERYVDARLARQVALTKGEPLRLWAIVDEAAIRRQVGGRGVMRAQLLHILEASQQAHVTFQVIPFDKGGHPGMPGAFVLLEFPDAAETDLAYLENMAGDLFLDSEIAVRRYTLAFEHLRALALSPDDSLRLIARAANEG